MKHLNIQPMVIVVCGLLLCGLIIVQCTSKTTFIGNDLPTTLQAYTPPSNHPTMMYTDVAKAYITLQHVGNNRVVCSTCHTSVASGPPNPHFQILDIADISYADSMPYAYPVSSFADNTGTLNTRTQCFSCHGYTHGSVFDISEATRHILLSRQYITGVQLVTAVGLTTNTIANGGLDTTGATTSKTLSIPTVHGAAWNSYSVNIASLTGSDFARAGGDKKEGFIDSLQYWLDPAIPAGGNVTYKDVSLAFSTSGCYGCHRQGYAANFRDTAVFTSAALVANLRAYINNPSNHPETDMATTPVNAGGSTAVLGNWGRQDLIDMSQAKKNLILYWIGKGTPTNRTFKF